MGEEAELNRIDGGPQYEFGYSDLSEVSPWAALSVSGLARYLVNKSFPSLRPWSLSTCRDQGTKDGL